jgi:hypothetical protein
MYCRSCGYALIGLPSTRCPECGRDFDPSNRKSFLARPPRTILRRIIKIILVLFCLMLPAEVYFGYLNWTVYRESKAIQFLWDNGVMATTYDTTPRWAKALLHGQAAWLWQRADYVFMGKLHNNVLPCMAVAANLESLRGLDLWDTSVTDSDLANLKGLTGLQHLGLRGTLVTDMGLPNLKGLATLQVLDLTGTHVTDAGVTALQRSLPKCQILH